MTSNKDVPHREEKKRAYRTPHLTVHGDLKALTMAKGGSSADGNRKPRTKQYGTNA